MNDYNKYLTKNEPVSLENSFKTKNESIQNNNLSYIDERIYNDLELINYLEFIYKEDSLSILKTKLINFIQNKKEP